jgi:hypothetical protein
VRVNVGGEPERDDSGLPPVDIEVPDDARELDRDVQAYHRELRALRRRQRANRLRGPLNRDQMALPLVAGCLLLALITSTLLIMFAADQTGVPLAPRPSVTQAPAKIKPTPGQIGGPLPASAVVIGKQTVPLSRITATKPAVLALVPADCACASALRRLGAQAARAHVPVYLVGTGPAVKQLPTLAAQAGQDQGQVAEDTGDVLGHTYQPQKLTAVLVRTGGTVTFVARQVTPPLGPRLTSELQQLSAA